MMNKFIMIITLVFMATPVMAANSITISGCQYVSVNSSAIQVTFENGTVLNPHNDYNIQTLSANNIFDWIAAYYKPSSDIYNKIYEASYTKGYNEHNETINNLCDAYLNSKYNSTLDPQKLHVASCSGYISGSQDYENNNKQQYNLKESNFDDGNTNIVW